MRKGLRARIAVSVVLLSLSVGAGQTPTAAQAPAADADLLESAKLGELARVRELLAKGTGVNTPDRRGLTPLIWASASGNAELVRQLLESGAVVDRRANDGTTALMLAASNGFTDVVRVLLAGGADVAAARGGVKARQLALSRGHAEAAALLEQAEGLGGRLLQGASEGNDTIVRQMLALGAPVNVADERGVTSLMNAARNGDLGMLQALLSRGADSSASDSQGRIQWAETSSSTTATCWRFCSTRASEVSPGVPPRRRVNADSARSCRPGAFSGVRRVATTATTRMLAQPSWWSESARTISPATTATFVGI